MVIAIDFDGTIVEHRFPEIGAPVPGAIRWMHEFQKAGAKLVLFTMRSDDALGPDGKFLTEAVDYCRRHGIEFYGVNTNPTQARWTSSPKAYAQIYIDDAAFGCPLCASPRGRPFVNWDVVGPAVMNQIAARREAA